MTLSVAGETHDAARPLLSPYWYKQLQPKQLLAYIRHAYIWRQHGTTNLRSQEQSRRIARWDGGEDSYGCKFTAVWPRIAKMILAREADPGIWVAAHFSAIAISKNVSVGESYEMRDVSPSQLCGKESEKIYNEYCDSATRILQHEYETAGRTIALRVKSLARLKISRADQFLCAICDESYVTASPFLRHGFADQAKAVEAADKYLWPAAFTYESLQRIYDDSVEPWLITDKLLDAVEVIRTHWRRVE